MTAGKSDDERLRPLPVRPRPRSGETTDSYVRRLAHANHLKPSYLRGYLSGPPYYYTGRVRADRLAAVTSRTIAAIERAFPPLAAEHGRTADKRSRRDGQSAERTRVEREQLFSAIRRDAVDGHSVRAIARRNQVSRRTVRQALNSPVPPPRKQPVRESPLLDLVRERVDTLGIDIHSLNARQVWELLFDDHDAPVSYATVVYYIRQQRPAGRRRSDAGSPGHLDTAGAFVQQSSRDLFAAVRKRPGMFGVRNFASASAFVLGYDAATGFTALAGFREFLIPQFDGGNNLIWSALVRHLVLGGFTDPMDEAANSAATDGLFRLLDEFLALRDQHGGLLRIYDDYLTWLKNQSWYDGLKHLVIPPRGTTIAVDNDTADDDGETPAPDQLN